MRRLALALLLLWFALSARAEAAGEIVVIAPSGALKERVGAELRALGFSVRYESHLSPTAAPSALAQREQAVGSSCTLQLELTDEVVHVSVYTAEHDRREEQFGTQPPTNVASLAVRITEFARAVLLESVQDQPAVREAASAYQLAPAAPPPSERSARPPPPPAPVLARASASPPATSKGALELGAAALGSAGGLGAGYGLALAAGGFVTRTLRLAASAFAPLSAQSHATREGSSQSRVTLIAADLRGAFRRQARFRPSLGGGLGAAVLSTAGRGTGPNHADASSRRITAGAYLRLGAGYHVTSRFALRLDATLGAQLSRFALTYAGRESAHWGVPWFMGAFSLEFAIP